MTSMDSEQKAPSVTARARGWWPTVWISGALMGLAGGGWQGVTPTLCVCLEMAVTPQCHSLPLCLETRLSSPAGVQGGWLETGMCAHRPLRPQVTGKEDLALDTAAQHDAVPAKPSQSRVSDLWVHPGTDGKEGTSIGSGRLAQIPLSPPASLQRAGSRRLVETGAEGGGQGQASCGVPDLTRP